MVSRRQFIGAVGAGMAVGLAGCSQDVPPEKTCTGACEYIETWEWEYNSGTAFADPEFFISIVPTDDAPVLDVDITGYYDENSLAHVTTETVTGQETYRYVPSDPVKAVEINVSESTDD